MTGVHLFFYQAVLQQFVRVNKFMQLENPLIPIVHELLHDFLKKLCCRFLDVKRVKVMGAQAIDYDSDLAKKTNEQMDIGFTTRTALRKLIDDGHGMNKVRQLFSGIRLFYVEALKYRPLNSRFCHVSHHLRQMLTISRRSLPFTRSATLQPKA